MTTLASHPAIEPKTRSDAAQAVYEAAHEAWVTKDDPSPIAAAALRAAAAQIAAEKVPPHVTGNVYQPWRNGRATAMEHLLAIATELEGANG
jgi:propanediol dehydratase small subunit